MELRLILELTVVIECVILIWLFYKLRQKEDNWYGDDCK